MATYPAKSRTNFDRFSSVPIFLACLNDFFLLFSMFHLLCTPTTLSSYFLSHYNINIAFLLWKLLRNTVGLLLQPIITCISKQMLKLRVLHNLFCYICLHKCQNKQLSISLHAFNPATFILLKKYIYYIYIRGISKVN